MAVHVTSARDIPKAPYYVTTTDTFMSGWGGAKGRINKLILPCTSAEEAEIVAQNARNRSDQKRVSISSRKPYVGAPGIFWQVMIRSESNRWYQPGGFTKESK